MAMELSKFKVPAGSIIIDGALVIALIWSQASTVATLQGIDTRLHAAEATIAARGGAEARISVLETQVTVGARDRTELKEDILKRLERIESKLDQVRQ